MKKSSVTVPQVDRRLVGEAENKSKALIGVGDNGRPFLDYVLFNARSAGYEDIVIVIGENDASMRAHYGEADRGNEFHGLKISYAIQKIPPGRSKPLGTADAVSVALRSRPDWKGKKFTVCNSDNLYSVDVLRTLLRSVHPSAMIDYDREALQFGQSRIEQFAVIQKDREGWLAKIVEKPLPHELLEATAPDGRVGVSMNIFRFAYDSIVPILKLVPLHPRRNEKELPSAIMMMIENATEKRVMMTYSFAEFVPDLTNKDDIPLVQQYLQKHFPNFSLELR